MLSVRTHRKTKTEFVQPKKASRLLVQISLNVLLRLHSLPINLLVSEESSGGKAPGKIYLEVGFPLRCFPVVIHSGT